MPNCRGLFGSGDHFAFRWLRIASRYGDDTNLLTNRATNLLTVIFGIDLQLATAAGTRDFEGHTDNFRLGNALDDRLVAGRLPLGIE